MGDLYNKTDRYNNYMICVVLIGDTVLGFLGQQGSRGIKRCSFLSLILLQTSAPEKFGNMKDNLNRQNNQHNSWKMCFLTLLKMISLEENAI